MKIFTLTTALMLALPLSAQVAVSTRRSNTVVLDETGKVTHTLPDESRR